MSKLPNQDAENVRQRRSRLESILNVARGYASGFNSPAALLAERRVLARRGWAGEKSGLFEHPAEAFLAGYSSGIA